LQWYVLILQDRFSSIEDAAAGVPGIRVIAPPKVAASPYSGFDAYTRAAVEEEFNAHLYARVANALGVEVLETDEPCLPLEPFRVGRGSAPSRGARALAGTFVSVAAALHGGRVALHRMSGFSNATRLALALRSGGRVLPLWSPLVTPPEIEPDQRRRSRLAELLAGGARGALAARVAGFAADDLPTSYLEGFAEMVSAAVRMFPAAPAAIFSTTSWYLDDYFKVWAADAAEAGTRLLGGQHGGNYGLQLVNPSQTIERRLVDRYYTWGWTDVCAGAPAVPMPAPLLIATPARKADAGDGLLFVSTAAARYVWLGAAACFPDYLAWQERFVRALPPGLFASLAVRLYREDFGWDIEARWREWCPQVRVQDWSVTFSQALAGCRLYVCDHLSTTYAQALAARKPTVLFWDPAMNPFVPESAEVVASLRRVGILHDSPESAAAAIATILEDVDAWWADPHRRAAVDAFCDRYARTADDAMQQWLAEFDAVISGGTS